MGAGTARSSHDDAGTQFDLREDGAQVMRYRIEVRGHVSTRVSRLIPGFDAIPHGATTDLVGDLIDQAELFGVLDQVRGMGLELIALIPVE